MFSFTFQDQICLFKNSFWNKNATQKGALLYQGFNLFLDSCWNRSQALFYKEQHERTVFNWINSYC